MQRLRFWIIFLWIFTAFALNIERLDIGAQENIVNLNSFVYFLAGIAVISTILLPREWEVSTSYIVYFWVLIYLIIKFTTSKGQPIIGGLYTYISIVEIVILIVLVILTHKVMESLHDLENTVANITMTDVSFRVKKLEQAGSDISQEFTRSRRYKRPLSVITIKLNPEGIQSNTEHFSEDVIRLMMSRYAIGNLIRTLDRKLRRPDMILNHYNKNRIILLLPETNVQAAQTLSKIVQEIVEGEIGSDIFVGFATFPDNAITFDDLVSYAEDNSRAGVNESDQLIGVENTDKGV